MSCDDRRSELIDVALREFAEHGVEATSMKALAQKAGVSPALFYHYFRSKEELLTLAITRDSLGPQLTAMIDPDRQAIELLPRIAGLMESHLRERRHLVWLFLSALRTHEAVRARMDEERERVVVTIADYLDARVRAGELRFHDTRMAASTIASLLITPYVFPDGTDGQLQWFVQLMLSQLVIPQET